MPQQDAEASELNEAEEVDRVPFPTIGEAPVVEQPCEQAFDLPALHVVAQRPPVLRPGPGATRAMRRDQLDPAFFPEPKVERIAVVSSVSNKTIGCVLEKTGIERGLDERDFMRRSTCNPCGDRKTRAVCDRHDLCALAPPRLSDGGAPFLAPEKVPSMKHSLRSIPPRLCRCSARA